MKRILAFLLAIVTIFIFNLSVFGKTSSENTVQSNKYVESVNISFPDINVFVNGFDSTQDLDAKATLDGEALTYSGSKSYNPDNCSTCIYFLVDISGSVTTDMYNSIKSCVKKYIQNKNQNVTVKLYTFSQNTSVILDGSESFEEVSKKLDSVNVTKNGYTALYDALYLVHDTAAEEEKNFDRQLVCIFTDGANEDDKAKRSLSETENLYKVLDLPVYAMCMNSANDASKQSLGEFSRLSGGTNRIYTDANIESEFNDLIGVANSCVCLNFVKRNNKASDKDSNLSIIVNGTAIPVVTVYESAVKIKDDNTAPTFSAEYSAENKYLKINFSEPVLKADKTDSYVITNSNGKAIPVDSVKYDSSNNTAYLYFSGRFYSDEYVIEMSGITDDSFSANKVKDGASIDVTADSPSLKILDYWWIFIIPLSIAIIILLVLLIVKRKRKINNVKELFEVENENNYEVRHHIVNASVGNPIVLDITTGNMNNQIKTRISSSLIFGRSDACDICIDDVKLSRQHFVIETEGNGDLSITDLNSTNGTYLNGIKLVSKVKLNNGDVVSAGLSTLSVHY